MSEQPEQPEDRSDHFIGDLEEWTLVSPEAGEPVKETKDQAEENAEPQ